MIIYYTHDFGSNKGESHQLLEEAIARHIGDGVRASELVGSLQTSGEYGKPVIRDFLPFSISHSRSSWAVLIAERECGLDIQYHRRSDAGVIAQRFYAPEDAAVIKKFAENGQDPDDEFFRIWARREALVKAAGGSVVATDIPSVLGSEVTLDGELWKIRDITIPGCDKLKAAICTMADEEGEQQDNLIFEEL